MSNTQEVSEQKICRDCRTRPTRTPRARRCEVCAADRRKWQLAYNNMTWRERAKAGQAKHRLQYNGSPTRWAVLHEAPSKPQEQPKDQTLDESAIEDIVKRVLKRILV